MVKFFDSKKRKNLFLFNQYSSSSDYVFYEKNIEKYGIVLAKNYKIRKL